MKKLHETPHQFWRKRLIKLFNPHQLEKIACVPAPRRGMSNRADLEVAALARWDHAKVCEIVDGILRVAAPIATPADGKPLGSGQ